MRVSSMAFPLGALLAATLAGCGGGGGSSSGSPPQSAEPLQITAGNYLAVAQESLSSAFYLSNSAALVTGAQVSGDPQLLSFGLAQLSKLPRWFAVAPRLVSGVTTTQVEPCGGGGSMTITVSDANGNQQLEAGDSATLVLANCVNSGLSMSGTLGIAVTALTGNLDSDVYSAAMTMTFTNLDATTSAGNMTGNGSIGVALTSTALNTGTVNLNVSSFASSGSYGGMSSTRVLQNYTVSETRTPTSSGFLSTTSVAGTFSSSALESRSITLVTIAPLLRVSTDNYPASGQVKALGLNGSQVRLTAQNRTSVLIELDADGNGVYESAASKLWSDML